MSFVKYGSYQHPDNEANLINFRSIPLYSRRGFRWGRRNIMQIEGEILATTQAAFQTAINNLVTVYSVDGNDFGFYDGDSNLTNHSITSSASLTGTKVVMRDWPRSDGAEWATKRTFRVAVQADFVDLETGQGSKWFYEEILYRGTAGNRQRFVQLDQGVAVAQLTNQQTTQTIIQSGEAIHQQTPPGYPGPIFTPSSSLIEHVDQREEVPTSPRRERNGYYDFGSRWRYVFESTTARSGLPNAGT